MRPCVSVSSQYLFGGDAHPLDSRGHGSSQGTRGFHLSITVLHMRDHILLCGAPQDATKIGLFTFLKVKRGWSGRFISCNFSVVA